MRGWAMAGDLGYVASRPRHRDIVSWHETGETCRHLRTAPHRTREMRRRQRRGSLKPRHDVYSVTLPETATRTDPSSHPHSANSFPATRADAYERRLSYTAGWRTCAAFHRPSAAPRTSFAPPTPLGPRRVRAERAAGRRASGLRAGRAARRPASVRLARPPHKSHRIPAVIGECPHLVWAPAAEGWPGVGPRAIKPVIKT